MQSIKFPKAAMINYCRRRKLPIVVAGAAGGQIDPTQIRIADLSQTIQDPLLAKLRTVLRRKFGFPQGGKKVWGYHCFFSTEALPTNDMTCWTKGPGGPQFNARLWLICLCDLCFWHYAAKQPYHYCGRDPQSLQPFKLSLASYPTTPLTPAHWVPNLFPESQKLFHLTICSRALRISANKWSLNCCLICTCRCAKLTCHHSNFNEHIKTAQ